MKNFNAFRFQFFLVGFCLASLAVLAAFRINSYQTIQPNAVVAPEDDEYYVPIQSYTIPEPEKKVDVTAEPVRTPFPTDVFKIIEDHRKKEIAPTPPAVLPKPGTIKFNMPAPPDDEIYTYFEEKATFPGGEDALKAFIEKNINYPEGALEIGKEGIVRIKFIVEKDGSVSNIEVILDGLGYGASEESVRVIRNMPRWTPAKFNGRHVRSLYVQPIVFKIY